MSSTWRYCERWRPRSGWRRRSRDWRRWSPAARAGGSWPGGVGGGVLPALGGPRGPPRLVLAGETVGAEQAALIGLISEAVPADSLGAAVDALLDRLRSLSAAALRATVQALRVGVAGGGPGRRSR